MALFVLAQVKAQFANFAVFVVGVAETVSDFRRRAYANTFVIVGLNAEVAKFFAIYGEAVSIFDRDQIREEG